LKEVSPTALGFFHYIRTDKPKSGNYIAEKKYINSFQTSENRRLSLQN
jgi:hypothetical protein